MTDNKENLINKIRKMLALGDASRGGFEAECENALRLAKKLMAENNIDMADVEQAKSGKEVEYEFGEQEGFDEWIGTSFELTLAFVVENLCGIKSFRRRNASIRKSKLYFMGTPEDVAIAREMYMILNRMVKARARTQYNPAVHGNTPYRCYAEGFTAKLVEKSKEMVKFEEQPKQEKYALMVVNKDKQLDTWINKTHKFKTSHSRSVDHDPFAYALGVHHAASVNLGVKGVIAAT